MAKFLDDNPLQVIPEGTYRRRPPLSIWRDAIAVDPGAIEAARTEAIEACEGELVMFLELVE